MKKLYVGNLSFGTTEADLRNLFQPYSSVATVTLITDRDTGQSRGFAFVEMTNEAEADAAIKSLNGKETGGRALTVNEARPQTDRGRAPRGGGFGGGRGGDRQGSGGGRDRRGGPRW